MSGKKILKDQKFGLYGPDRNQSHLFFLSRNKPIKVIIVTDSQSIYDVASAAGTKIWL